MKQKTAIVAAFMADPEILILDEPTTGLDPLMRKEFIGILDGEKKKGKTILMSSHMFDEVERICDQVAMIKDGRIVAVKATNEVKHHEEKVYKIEFKSYKEYVRFLAEPFDRVETRESQNQVIVKIHDSQINMLFKTLSNYDIRFMTEMKLTLERYFQSLDERGKSNAE
jgi:ABC-2 type transport system ATP-binding protein